MPVLQKIMAGRQDNNGDHDSRHATETPDVSHIKNLDCAHEASDVDVPGILKFVLGLTVLSVAVFVLMWGMFRLLNAQETEKEPKAGPMAMTEQERLPPEPRLQAAKGFGVKLKNGETVNLENKEPEAEYRVLREQWEGQLKCSGQPEISFDTGCVPIDRAMEQVLQGGGLPVRPAANNSGKPAGLTPPTAWSSGRVSGGKE